jgi:hypothetical protein
VSDRTVGVAGCTVAVLLLLVSLWSSHLMLANWWAGGGPPAPEPARTANLERGNLFLWVACASLVTGVGLGVWGWSRKKRSSGESAGPMIR